MDVDIGFVGEIEHVDVDVLNHIAQDYIPVIASVGADAEGSSYNVNADTAAGAIAEAMGAFKVIFLTDVAGWLANPEDATSLISETDVDEIRRGIAERPKIPRAKAHVTL